MPFSPEFSYFCESLEYILSRGDQHSHVVITESDRKAKLKKITLNIDSGNWFSMHPGGRKAPLKMSDLLVMSCHYKHHCSCDCVIIKDTGNNQLDITYLDLKSNNPSGYEAQFKSMRQFIQYAINLIEEFKSYKFQIYKERFVIIHTNGASISKTTSTPQRKNTAPNNALKIAVQNSGELSIKQIFSLS